MNAATLLLLMSGGGAAPVVYLPFTDEFARADGDLANNWEYTAGKWTVSGNAANGNPALSASELVTNGGFDANTSGWTTDNSIIASVAGGQSGNCLLVTNSAALPGFAYQAITVVVGKWYRLNVYYKSGTSNDDRIRIGTSLDGSQYAGLATGGVADWTQYTYILRATSTSLYIGLKNNNQSAAGLTSFWDTVTVKEITLADMFSTRELGSSNIDISLPMTLTTNQRAGIVICLDSNTSPANFIIATHDGKNGVLTKCVAGTYTQLVSAAATYAALATLRVVKSGNTVQLFYNGAQVGTDQTVSDAGITSNTRHGMFVTSSAALLASFAAINP